MLNLDIRRPNAFVSYSWDGEEHEKWVHNLVNRLRSDGSGVDASFDKFELYDKTVNLNQMMVKAVRDNDYVIVVLTENYGKRADKFQGGVGFEAELLLSDLRRDKDKIIFIMRHQGDFESVFPSYLRDYYAIDFSNDKEFDKKFEELVHRLYRYNSYEKAPLGSMPNYLSTNIRQPTMEIKQHLVNNDNVFESFSNLTVPKNYTDYDKEEFLRSSYDDLKQRFTQLFEYMKTQTTGFTYQLNEENSNKLVYKFYIQGQQKTCLKMQIGGFSYSSPTINFSYGNQSVFDNNSFNEMLSIEEKDKHLVLRMLVSFRNNNNPINPIDIVKRIWEDHLLPYLKY